MPHEYHCIVGASMGNFNNHCIAYFISESPKNLTCTASLTLAPLGHEGNR